MFFYKMLLKKGIAVMFVDNFNGRNVISAGADQAQVSTYSFYIDAFMTLEYLSKNPKINIKMESDNNRTNVVINKCSNKQM